jgi:hypothetical protein
MIYGLSLPWIELKLFCPLPYLQKQTPCASGSVAPHILPFESVCISVLSACRSNLDESSVERATSYLKEGETVF